MKSRKIVNFSKIMSFTGISHFIFGIERIIHGPNYIRVINYHGTPSDTMVQFESQLNFYTKYYESVNLEELDKFFSKSWTKKKPGLIISFDDGLECNYIHASRLLEKHNFVGWFFIPTNLIGTQFCKPEHRTGSEILKYMSWTQVQDLDLRHVIGCHTANHIRLSDEIGPKQLHNEIVDSKLFLEEKLGHSVDSFCWVGGELNSYSRNAAQLVKRANYKYAFLTNHCILNYTTKKHLLNRSNIESDWPIHLVKLYISGIMDLKYFIKRRKVNQIIDIDD